MVRWNSLSYEIENTENNRSLIQDIERFKIGEYDSDKNVFTIRTLGMSSVIFNLEDYIDSQLYFQGVVRFFQNKDFSKEIKIIQRDSHETWVEENYNFSDEISKIKNMLGENNIDIKVDNRNLYNIPISIFSFNSQISKVKRAKYICLMLLFSNVSKYENNNFKFKLTIDNREITSTYSFGEDLIDNQLEYLEELYNWIIGDGDNYKQKLNVIRSVLLKNKSFIIENSLLNSVKSIFQRIINVETNKYFDEVAHLKEDFLKITERENDIYQSLHLKLMGWLSALAFLIFDKIKDYGGENVISRLLDSDSQKTILLLVLLVCALLVILIIYVLEMRKNQDEYWKLKDFYTNSLMFNGDDFENKVKFPKIDNRYMALILGVAGILLLRVLFSKILFIVLLVALLVIYRKFLRRGLIENITAKLNKKEE